ncbi:MAG: DUF2357 domain-containing protein [Coprococcus sp.]|nr:DUF2357 domain-containing protein [Coprococcus sp.]
MADTDTISELYTKYTSSVEEGLADDRYFQYLFEMIQAGDNTLHQTSRILHKVVDESWLTVIEDGLQAIFNIVDKPRRFITTSEEVVPVALAKKITADSVRHLSQNTRFIGTNAAGEIQPTHVLNVTTEESYDLYENRFVYHLIQRLFAFVDKRTDVIFWSTGDETCNVMQMESKIDDAYEEISYKVEMTIKNRQSLVENDSDNMAVFKRIDRVRRLSRSLRNSSFCEIMNGCAKVHSPIQRTNLMMKDPDYRTCYKLWQFIEGYDAIGYRIEEQDTALEMDEEYLLQMYINLIGNYTVFKSLLEADPRQMEEIAQETKEPVRPKFIKEIKEEIVENRDLPDVEIRKVFVEEVTQAQIEAEEKLAEETARAEQLEQTISEMEYTVSDLQWQMDSISQQMEMLEQMRADLEAEKETLVTQLEEEKKNSAALESAMKEADVKAKEAIDAANEEARKTLEAAEREKTELIEEHKREKEEEAAKIRAEAAAMVAQAREEAQDRIAEARIEAEKLVADAKAEADRTVAEIREKATNTIEETKAAATAEIAQMKTAAEEEIEATKTQAAEEIAVTKAQAAEDIAVMKTSAEAMVAEANERRETEVKEATEQMQAAKAESARDKSRAEAAEQRAAELEEEIALVKAETGEAIQNMTEECRQTMEAVKQDADEQIAKIQEETRQKLADASAVTEAAQQTAAEAEKRAEQALAKAEANTLSHYIVNALQERKERKNAKHEER